MDVRETTELDEDERIITIADGSDTGIVNLAYLTTLFLFSALPLSVFKSVFAKYHLI